MTTAALLNGQLLTEGFIIALLLCTPEPLFLTTVFPFSCQEPLVLKCSVTYRLLHIFTHTTGFFIIWKLTLILKERLKSQTIHIKMPFFVGQRQTVQTQTSCCRMWHLIRVSTVCLYNVLLKLE